MFSYLTPDQKREFKQITERGNALWPKIEAGTASEAEKKEFADGQTRSAQLTHIGLRGPDKAGELLDSWVDGGFESRSGGGEGYTDVSEERSAKPLETRKFGELIARTGGNVQRPGETWKDGNDFFRSLLSRRHDPRLESRDNDTITDAGGGFAVPSFLLERIFDASLPGEVVRPRARIYPMASNVLRVPAWDDDSHVDGSVFGGFSSQWVAEGEPFTVQSPQLRRVVFQAKKLGILSRVSNELAADSPMFSASLVQAMSQATSFFLDSAFIRGSGSPGVEGILSADALISVSKESGQAAATIQTENIVKMWSRLRPGSHANAAWLIHPDTLPQLLTLSLAVGTGGSEWSGVLRDDGRGNLSMMGRPVIPTEHCSTLGTVGDIMLADLAYYGIGMRADVRIDTSEAPYFTSDEQAVRLKIRLDAKSLLSAAITPANGSDTLSPFVALATRA